MQAEKSYCVAGIVLLVDRICRPRGYHQYVDFFIREIKFLLNYFNSGAVKVFLLVGGVIFPRSLCWAIEFLPATDHLGRLDTPVQPRFSSHAYLYKYNIDIIFRRHLISCSNIMPRASGPKPCGRIYEGILVHQ